MLDYLKTNYQNAEIVVIIQPNLDNWKPGIEESIIEICEHYGVEYVLLPEDLNTCDNFVHPSKLGMQQIFDTIKDYFE